ncbi:tobamovirus multiplication protein 1 [Telopea speciosissima]|uniref:tobamovirus multiplication protein 1 n=1 Tax=Telopea speciosissima TaxID=54955 RepID=UPI001CC35564|nr:tobamovirus multiplication protein 1 [Telopea speciosissima]
MMSQWKKMLLAMESGRCFPKYLMGVYIALGCVDVAIAAVAIFQLIRIHRQNQQLGWTRQKVFHLMIGISNIEYCVYFISAIVSTCKGWFFWSHACAFVLMTCPSILFLAAFLLLLSFWVDLCHQANDEDEEDEDNSFRDSLLEKTQVKPGSSNRDSHRKCCPFHAIHVGSRQKFVILVIVLVFLFMMAFAVLIWIGWGKNPIDASAVARVYIDFFSVAMLLLGGALACYGLVLFLKMSKVRSDKASSEMWKVAGLAVVSVVCFTSSALVALLSDIPLLYYWHQESIKGVKTPVLIILYYCIGSSVPSAFVLWVMREMPPPQNRQAQSRIVTFIRDRPATMHHPQHWTTARSSQNQASRASPI